MIEEDSRENLDDYDNFGFMQDRKHQKIENINQKFQNALENDPYRFGGPE
jgi:hypothetical protein